MDTSINWEIKGISIPDKYRNRTYGNGKVFCPKCHDTRHDKRDTSLSINFATGEFNCHYCGWKGCAAERDHGAFNIPEPKREYKKPKLSGTAAMSQKAIAYFLKRGITYETLKDLKVTEGMEWMPQTNSECNTIQFNYYLKGELINTKFRTGDKKFKLVSGAELIPYNIDSVKGQTECIITEGEIDALTFHECGYKSVVSVPNGANANLEYLDKYMEEYFDDKDVIYIASDTDTKGMMLRDELIRRFGKERCRVITYGPLCKDANELMVMEGAEGVKKAVLAAPEIKVEGIFTSADFESNLDEIYKFGLKKGYTTGMENLDKLISFETKRLMVVTGIPGHGKSEFVDMIAERLNMRYGWKWAYFSPENMPLEYHASKIIEKLTGTRFSAATLNSLEYKQAKEYMENNFYFIAPPDNYKLDNVLAKAQFLVRRRGIKALVIDPYNKLESEMGTMSETQYISQVLDKMVRFAQLNDALVVLVAHPKKMSKDSSGKPEVPNLYDIAGSANFFNKTDFGMVVYRDRTKDVTEIHVEKVKFRHLGETGVCEFVFNTNNGRYTPKLELQELQPDNENHITQKKQSIQVQQTMPDMDDDNNDLPF